MYWNILCHSTLMTVLRGIMLSPHLTTEEKRGLRFCPQLCAGWRQDVKPARLIPWLAHGACGPELLPAPWVLGQPMQGCGYVVRGACGDGPLVPSFMCMTNGGPDIRDWASPPTPTFTPCPHPDHGLCEGAGTVPGMVSHWLPPCGVGS